MNHDKKGLNLNCLNDEQRDIFERILNHLNTKKMGYICVPTGWGKTFLSKHLMNKYYQDGKNILFIISRNNALLNQTYFADNKSLFPENESICISSKHDYNLQEIMSKIKSNSGYIVFASFQSIVNKKELMEIFSTAMDIIIVDEIHNFIKNKGSEFLKKIKDETYIFGMTATPFQGTIGNMKYVEDISDEMEVIEAKSLVECIRAGTISPLKYLIVKSEQEFKDLFFLDENLCGLKKGEPEIDLSTEDNRKRVILRTKVARDIYHQKVEDKEKVLVFCAPVRGVVDEKDKKIAAFHSKLTAAIFNKEIEEFIPKGFKFNNLKENGSFKDAVYLSS
ncbi:MAG: DEAD/DEAH box helicase family protein [bacterium]|nr:DEAD/DEAH box helicase family protein [bacterium]